MNLCGTLCTLLEYFGKKNLPQFQENSFVMRHFYKIILVQYNESDVERQISILCIPFGIIFGKRRKL